MKKPESVEEVIALVRAELKRVRHARSNLEWQPMHHVSDDDWALLNGAQGALESLIEKIDPKPASLWTLIGGVPEEHAIDPKHADVYAEVGRLFANAFPDGLVVQTRKGSGEVPQLRCGPFPPVREGGKGWAIVKYADGRREVVDLAGDDFVVQVRVRAREVPVA